MTVAEAPWGELERLLGAEGFSGGDNLAARPADAEQTAAVVRWAGERGIQIHVGQCRREGLPEGAAPRGYQPRCLRLELERMRRLRFYEPGDLTAGWDAGVTAAEVNRVLGERGQFLPVDDGRAAGTAMLGAILAAHRSGPLRHGYGTVRDFVIGIEAVTAAGQIVHGGGKVVKNVAGYDLMRLLIGSCGTLAVITGVHCKVFPALQPTETVRWPLADLAAAERLRTRLLHAPLRLIALELGTADYGAGRGAAGDAPWVALARFQGSEAVRARYRRELAAAGAELGLATASMAPDLEAEAWAQWEQPPLPWAMGAPSGVAVQIVRQTAEMARAEGRRLRLRGRLGLGVFGWGLEPMPAAGERRAWNARWRAMAAAAHPDAWLRDRDEPMAASWGGETGDQKSGGWMRGLRRHLDPRGVFAEAGAEARA